MLNPSKKYNLEYYLGVVDKIVAMGAHILGVKDSETTQDDPSISHTNNFYSGWCSQAARRNSSHWCHQEEVP